MQQRDRHRKLWKAVQKIGGAVEWVDDPLVLVTVMRAGFLSQYAVLRVGLAQGMDNDVFSLAVDLGDEVVTVLAGDRQGVQTVDVTDNQIARGTSGTRGNIEHGMHGRTRIVALNRSRRIPEIAGPCRSASLSDAVYRWPRPCVAAGRRSDWPPTARAVGRTAESPLIPY